MSIFNKELSHKYVLDHHLTGSNYICDPPVTDTDIDIVVLVQDDQINQYHYWLLNQDWNVGGSVHYEEETDEVIMGGEFLSYKMEEAGKLYNLIVTDNPEYYQRMVAATELSKRFNLLKKADRIACFRAVIEGEICGQSN